MSVYVSAELRRRIRAHFRDHCAYCHTPEALTVVIYEFEHILPRSLGGATSFENLCLSCPTCNNQKQSDIADIDPQGKADEIVRLFHPRNDDWDEHFACAGPELKAKSPIGRVTLYVLGINLPHRVAFRQLLIDEGVFPPADA